jgi:uncharacterized protein DUF4178
MTSVEAQPLADSGPVAGEVLTVEGGEWTVAGHATYTTDAGDHVDEWECEQGAELAYLLRESREPPAWFFTRKVGVGSVTVPSGEGIERAVGREPNAPPPRTAHLRGGRYVFAEANEGEYEETSGPRQRKTTWDYWDAAREWNLAVERWPDGRLDCYLGRYVPAGRITVRPGGTLRKGFPPLVAAGIVAGILFFTVMSFGAAVDLGLTTALLVLALGALAAVVVAGPAGRFGLLSGVVLGLVFSRFPPLTTLPGLAALVLGPAVATRWAVMRDAALTGAGRAGFVSVTAAVLAAGLYHYFWFAPGPRTSGQYFLAIGPAPIAGLVAALVALCVVRISRS